MNIGAMIEKQRSHRDISFARKLVQRGDSEPIGHARVHAAREKKFVQLRRLRRWRPARKSDALWKIGLVTQHQTNERFVPVARRVGESIRIVGKRWIDGKNSGGGL